MSNAQNKFFYRLIAEQAGCKEEDHDALVACLRSRDATNITAAFSHYQTNMRSMADLGFGGSSPCAQKKGPKKFYSEQETPTNILFSGNYEHAPMFFGANKKEGSYVYSVLYNEYFLPNELENDENFLINDLMPTLMNTLSVSNYYPFKEMLKDVFFDEGQVGDLYSMIPGLTDLFSVFFFKANAYELIQQNSKYAPSFWYGYDYSNTQKSLFHLNYMNPASKANLTHPGTSHGDESIFLFDVVLPLVWCDIGAIVNDALECLSHIGSQN